MAYTVYAAIDVGSNDVSMKIYQISASSGIKQIDYVSQYLALGRDTYRCGKIGYDLVEELCLVLLRFKNKMKEYKVKEYWAYASSAIREAANREVILDQIKLRTGIDVKVVSNSERHYLMYKGIASHTADFNNVIQKNTAILDMGAGSVQISIFDKQALAVTQNLRIGALRIKGLLEREEDRIIGFQDMLMEYIGNELDTFENFHMKDKSIKNIIAVGDEIQAMIKVVPELGITDSIDSEQMEFIYQRISTMQPQQMSMQYGIPLELASILLPAVVVYKIFLDGAKAEWIWTPKIDFCDSMAADYADTKKKVPLSHDFQEDILSMARNIAKRYHCNRTHINDVLVIAMEIFDRMRKIHGLDKRERLLLQIAVILHDCGKYINMNAGGSDAYNIIMATEIIGLSHKERELVANIVKYNTVWLPSYAMLNQSMSRDDYIVISKLTAILRVANALDRSHKQKIKNIKASLKDKTLLIMTDAIADISLERALFTAKADFFEEVYGIRPVIKQRRTF
ncbi:MAG: HD domain-containing protein [Lachnospiraceae bacterium]|nr:HD domain-containing protein [Lachnospiraceae bacterium]